MLRYKLMAKNNWFLIVLIVLALLTLWVWTDTIIHILNVTKELK